MMEQDDEKSRDEDVYHAELNPAMVWVVVVFSAGLGVTFLAIALKWWVMWQAVSMIWAGLALGFFFVAWRVFQFGFRPRIRMSGQIIEVNNWLRKVTFPVADISGLAVFERVRKAYSTEDRRIPEHRVTFLVFRLRSGKEIKFPLPRFREGRNPLHALEIRTGCEIESLPPQYH